MLTVSLILIPLIAAILLLPVEAQKASRLAFFASLISLAATMMAWLQLKGEAGASSLSVNYPWIASLGTSFSVSLDGISFLLVLLTNLLVPFILLSSFHKNYTGPFYPLVLLMQSALVGVFTAMDGFLFYVFWELALIPIYFICLLWGGENRKAVTFKFFVYTLFGSLLMLIALIYVYLHTPGTHSFALQELYRTGASLSATEQSWIFWAIFIAFAVKMPVFPFHTWQPDTYTSAPTQGTMLLSGLMLKMGTYGLIRWLIPITPVAFQKWAGTAIVLSVIGIVYGSCLALVQKDFKRLIAYSSIAHVGLISAGILCFNIQGIQGALFQMFSHGIAVVGLFYIVDLIALRTQTREISQLGGIVNVAPSFAKWFLIIVLGSVALPLTNGFIGEFLLLSSLYQYKPVLCAIGGLTVILGAVYMLRGYQYITLGQVNSLTQKFTDLSFHEKTILVPLALLIILFGVYPAPLLKLTEPAVQTLLQTTIGF